MLQSIILTFIDSQRPKSGPATGGGEPEGRYLYNPLRSVSAAAGPTTALPRTSEPGGRYLYNPLRSDSAAAGPTTTLPRPEAEPVRATPRNRREPISGFGGWRRSEASPCGLASLIFMAMAVSHGSAALRTWVVEISP